MSEHTPGPWRPYFCTRNQRLKTGDWICVDINGYPVLTHDTKRANAIAEANARLCAAAPTLLAALKAHIPWEKEPPQGWGQWADAAHAIAKAEGRSE